MPPGDRVAPHPQAMRDWARVKTQTPTAPTGSLERERLLEPLMGSDGAGIIVVRAPAGSGKTTLLAQWASLDRARDFAWVSLDESDNDVVTLWRRIVDAMGVAAPEEAASATEHITRASPDVTGAVIPSVLNGVRERDRPLVLVLDDYHAITDQGCHDSVRQLALTLDGPFMVIISSRIEPPVNLARLKVHGRAHLLSEGDLAFNGSEVVQLLARHGIRPTEQLATQLLTETDGWATGVHLSIGRPSTDNADLRRSAQRALIRDFLMEEVLDPMDPADLDFLRRCSVLTTLSPALCERVTQSSEAERRLAALSKGNVLLTEVDQKSHIYRLHHLLREALQDDLRQRDPEAFDHHQARAAQWFIDHDRPTEAVEHALNISTPELAADTIAGSWFETIMTGSLTTVTRWLGHFDDEELRTFPFLMIAAAWTAGFEGNWPEAWRYSEASIGLTATAMPPDGTASYESARALMFAGLGLGGVQEARAQAEIAYRIEPPTSEWRPLAAALFGAASLAAGRKGEARSALSEAATATTGPSGVTTYAMGQLAILNAIEQRWAAAERLCNHAIEAIERLGLENLVSSGAAYAMHAAAAAQRGDHPIAQLRLQAVNPLLPSLSTAMPFDAFQIHLLLAETYETIGQGRDAAVHAKAALRHHDLLRDVGVFRARLEALVAELPSDTGTSQNPDETPTLTPRERDVLALLPTSLSLRDIGEQLYVSRDTVKTYVARIYRKLDVSTRSTALTRAAQLGLIEQGRPDRAIAGSSEC